MIRIGGIFKAYRPCKKVPVYMYVKWDWNALKYWEGKYQPIEDEV